MNIQQLEDAEYEANAHYDYMWEAYGAEAWAEHQANIICDRLEREEYMAEMEAAFGPYVQPPLADLLDDEIPF
jgi:hypothetical protein